MIGGRLHLSRCESSLCCLATVLEDGETAARGGELEIFRLEGVSGDAAQLLEGILLFTRALLDGEKAPDGGEGAVGKAGKGFFELRKGDLDLGHKLDAAGSGVAG